MSKHRRILSALSLGTVALLMAAPIARADGDENNAFPVDPHSEMTPVRADAQPEVTDRIIDETIAATPVEAAEDVTDMDNLDQPAEEE